MKNFAIGLLLGWLTMICGTGVFALLMTHEERLKAESKKETKKAYCDYRRHE